MADTQRDIYPLDHCPNGCYDQNWADQKLGAS